MYLWILKPVDPLPDHWDPWYDKAFGMVVRAKDEKEARKIAGENAGDEFNWYRTKDSVNPWLDSQLSICEKLSHKGDAGLILRDFASA